jgi:hypothetical protein
MPKIVTKRLSFFWSAPLLCLLLSSAGWGQNFRGTITGSVTDQSGAVVPNAEVTLTSVGTGVVTNKTTGAVGLYTFPDLSVGVYNLKVAAKGFRDYIQNGISIDISQTVTVNVKLEIGPAVQSINVTANASPLNYENGERKGTVPGAMVEDLPLLFSGTLRSVAAFVTIEPGITTSSSNSPYDARINGGMVSGDEAVLDGISMQEGAQNQNGMVAIYNDYPITPDTISEVSVLTSNYAPQYGNTTGGVITAVTKSGTSKFHGTLYDNFRNSVLNARSYGQAQRSLDIENDWGFTIGGPIKWPKWPATNRKAFFFLGFDDLYARGGLQRPFFSLPTMQERQGDFSDWKDTAGNLIPIYDPATTQANPSYNSGLPVGPNNLPYIRQQFMGCDGHTPNVICPSDPRLVNSYSQGWTKYLPATNLPGVFNNWIPPSANVPSGSTVYNSLSTFKADWYITQRDHVSFTTYQQRGPSAYFTEFPAQIDWNTIYPAPSPWPADPMYRLNWDHTFSPTLVSTLNYGLTKYNGSAYMTDDAYVNDVPKIPGVASHNEPSMLEFQDYQTMGGNGAYKIDKFSNIVNELVTWVHGKHTFKFGGEMRWNDLNYNDQDQNRSGTFYFSRLNTGLSGINSGNDWASFLLGQVDNANCDFPTVGSMYARGTHESLNAGDTWKVTPKLSLDYGVRYDVVPPNVDKFNKLSVFDPNMVNPDAGNRLGALAFAGNYAGPASLGRRAPEYTWYGGVAPRLGFAYSVNPKTVVRGGYGIFYMQEFYPGWAAGSNFDGFNATPTFSSSQGGITAAFLLQDGFPQNFPHPPFINAGFDNGTAGPLYRPFNSNRLPNTQQWNLTVERQFTTDFSVDAAYVGNKGTRLPSQTDPLNTLNPSLLSMGPALYDQFTPGMTSLDGVSIPYAGWVQQMTACAPTVAQALLPYPQYCGGLTGLTENAGNSTYHSFQLEVEKRVSHGWWFLGAYTASKEITDANWVQSIGSPSGISPFQRERNKSLATTDVPQVLNLTLVYNLPFGQGQRFVNKGGVANKLIGGWEFETIFRTSSGVPYDIGDSNCNVPAQFRAGCIPAVIGNPWAQSKGNFNLSMPLLNASAFQNSGPQGFQFDLGSGSPVSNLRGFPFRNQDIALLKNTNITEGLKVQFRAQFFNTWNWHSFSCSAQCLGGSGIITDLGNPNFGMWDGEVTSPRNIQFVMKLIF